MESLFVVICVAVFVKPVREDDVSICSLGSQKPLYALEPFLLLNIPTIGCHCPWDVQLSSCGFQENVLVHK